MGTLAEIFEQGDQKKLKSHFRNLVNLARLDGVLEEKEKNLLDKIARKIGLTDEQKNEVLKNKDAYPMIPPSSKEERIERFVNLVEMALTDDLLSPEENTLIHRLGYSLGFKENEIEENLKLTIEKSNAGIDKEQIIEFLMQ